MGTYVPIPSSSSSKVFDAPVLFLKWFFVIENIICFISMEPSHYVCGNMQWNGYIDHISQYVTEWSIHWNY